MGFWLTVLAGVTVLAIGWAAGVIYGKIRERRKFKKYIYKIVDNLYVQIGQARKTDNFEELIIKTQAIIKNRDAFKRVLEDLAKELNSEMDQLSTLIAGKTLADLQSNEKDIRRLLGVLHEAWPTKKAIIAGIIEKFLAIIRMNDNDMNE